VKQLIQDLIKHIKGRIVETPTILFCYETFKSIQNTFAMYMDYSILSSLRFLLLLARLPMQIGKVK
jgi:hypothetical protein